MLNNEAVEIADNLTLAKFIDNLEIEISGIAVAINEEIISRTNWSLCKLKLNDNIVLIKATAGG